MITTDAGTNWTDTGVSLPWTPWDHPKTAVVRGELAGPEATEEAVMSLAAHAPS